MDANKTRVVTNASYKNSYFNSLPPTKKPPIDQVLQKLQTSNYEDRKYEIDRLYYATTYELSYGKEKYAQL